MKKEDQEKIVRYVNLVRGLVTSRFFQEARNLNFKIAFEQGKPLQQELAGFDEDLFKSALMDLRKIDMAGEPTHFYHINNLLMKSVSNEADKLELVQCRDVYHQLRTMPNIQMKVNDGPKSSINIFDYWLNGHYFHGDIDKEKTLAVFGFALPTSKFFLVDTVSRLITICALQAQVGERVLKAMPSE